VMVTMSSSSGFGFTGARNRTRSDPSRPADRENLNAGYPAKRELLATVGFPLERVALVSVVHEPREIALGERPVFIRHVIHPPAQITQRAVAEITDYRLAFEEVFKRQTEVLGDGETVLYRRNGVLLLVERERVVRDTDFLLEVSE